MGFVNSSTRALRVKKRNQNPKLPYNLKEEKEKKGEKRRIHLGKSG